MLKFVTPASKEITKTVSKCIASKATSTTSKKLFSSLTTNLKRSQAVRPAVTTMNKRSYMCHSELPEETKMLYEMIRDFANDELAPNAGKWDKNHEFPHEAVQSLVRVKFFYTCAFLYKCAHYFYFL